MTYLRPLKFYMNFMPHVHKNIFARIMKGERDFTIKVRFSEDYNENVYLTDNTWVARHCFTQDEFIETLLNGITGSRREETPVYLNVMLDTYRDVRIGQELSFIMFCNKLKKAGFDKRVYLYGGKRSCDGAHVVLTIPESRPPEVK